MDGGMLSQDEINALLSGMDLSEDGDSESTGGADAAGDAASTSPISDPLEGVNPDDVLTEV